MEDEIKVYSNQRSKIKRINYLLFSSCLLFNIKIFYKIDVGGCQIAKHTESAIFLIKYKAS